MDPWAAAAQTVSTVFDNSGILVSLKNTEKLQEYVFILILSVGAVGAALQELTMICLGLQ